jgi:hypothetical protein
VFLKRNPVRCFIVQFNNVRISCKNVFEIKLAHLKTYALRHVPRVHCYLIALRTYISYRVLLESCINIIQSFVVINKRVHPFEDSLHVYFTILFSASPLHSELNTHKEHTHTASTLLISLASLLQLFLTKSRNIFLLRTKSSCIVPKPLSLSLSLSLSLLSILHIKSFSRPLLTEWHFHYLKESRLSCVSSRTIREWTEKRSFVMPRTVDCLHRYKPHAAP